ncbi:MAG: aldehyde dehydrogenase family protein, partial [Terrimicrobiaceae bacterium]
MVAGISRESMARNFGLLSSPPSQRLKVFLFVSKSLAPRREKPIGISLTYSPTTLMKTYQNYINGRFTPSAGDGAIEVLNPSTGEVISRVPESTSEDLEMALDAAHAAQPAWA